MQTILIYLIRKAMIKYIDVIGRLTKEAVTGDIGEITMDKDDVPYVEQDTFMEEQGR